MRSRFFTLLYVSAMVVGLAAAAWARVVSASGSSDDDPPAMRRWSQPIDGEDSADTAR